MGAHRRVPPWADSPEEELEKKPQRELTKSIENDFQFQSNDPSVEARGTCPEPVGSVTPCGLFCASARGEKQTMTEHTVTVFSNQAGITGRVRSHGHMSLQVGHTCFTLRRQDFLDLAQIVQATERRLRKPLPLQLQQYEQSH